MWPPISGMLEIGFESFIVLVQQWRGFSWLEKHHSQLKRKRDVIKNGQWHIFPLISCGFHGKILQHGHLWSPQHYSNFLCGQLILAVRLPSLHIQPVAFSLSMQSIESVQCISDKIRKALDCLRITGECGTECPGIVSLLLYCSHSKS